MKNIRFFSCHNYFCFFISQLPNVNNGSYYEAPVVWAKNKDITSGTSATTFSPAANCTSAQVVTFLWRANGSPAVSGSSLLAKQYADQYYTSAVDWADTNRLLAGTNTAFAPDNNAPRANIVTYLYRDAGSPSV